MVVTFLHIITVPTTCPVVRWCARVGYDSGSAGEVVLIDIDHILERNRAWAERQTRADPDVFRLLARGQQPEMLWIGCSDSRVSPNLIMDLSLGEVFVHRNVANLVVPSDPSLLAVLQFAVETLRVRRVVVCGHYGCGGVDAFLDEHATGPLGEWLDNLLPVVRTHRSDLATLQGDALWQRLCELSVIEQVRKVAATDIVCDAWRAGADLEVHGLIYRIDDGRLERLCRQTGLGGLVLDSGRWQ
ncbi:MAG: carbonic anhydrase [Acidimicrobiia bacterium]|nr:carbonic anhydrase [Acidimicrobiia bacterium]